jgi:hypothetical protein
LLGHVSRGRDKAHPDASKEEDLLDQFLAYFKTYRGVRTVAGHAWEVLMDSELSGMLHTDHEEFSRMGSRPESAPLLAYIRQGVDLEAEKKNECEVALGRIQYGFDLYNRREGSSA